MDAPPPSQANASGRFVGLIFISIGVLWLVLTGLCTVAMLATLVGTDGPNGSDIALILIIAVPSALIGGAVYFIGRLLRPRP